MMRTKSEVDKHVQDVCSKLRKESERTYRCYNFAKLYYAIQEYDSARHYVSCYLAERPEAAGAHKLHAQCLEALKIYDKALEEYKVSLKLESKQPEVVLKVCELMVLTKAHLDAGTAKYWKERGEAISEHHPSVFKFKEYLLSMAKGGSGDQDELEVLLKKEIEARPLDSSLRIKLLNLYVSTNRVDTALKYAMELETPSTFRNNLSFYNSVNEVISAYEKSVEKPNGDFYLFKLCVLERLTALSFNNPPAFENPLLQFDQALHVASKYSTFNGKILDECIKHMSAQLCFHLATALLCKMRSPHFRNQSPHSFRALLLLAWAASPTDPSVWTFITKAADKNLLKLWEKDGAFRCSQAGHIILWICRDGRNQFLTSVSQQWCKEWRTKTYETLFGSNQNKLMSTSHFLHYNSFEELPSTLPIFSKMHIYDNVSQFYQPDSLQHMVWLGLRYLSTNPKHSPLTNNSYSPAYIISTDFKCTVFENLQTSTTNLMSCGIETLNRLDVESFLYAAVLCAAAANDMYPTDNASRDLDSRPKVLPVNLTGPLCTEAQSKWWSSAYSLQKSQVGNNLSEIRSVVLRGLEVIRLAGSHGMDVRLVVQLAKIFTEKASSSTSEVLHLEARALLYWKCAVYLLERLENKELIHVPENKLFNYIGKELTSNDIQSLIEEGRLFLACKHMKDNENEKAIEGFEKLKNPYASFYQALIYKKMAISEGENQLINQLLLKKSQASLHLTLDRLRAPHFDSKHPLNAELDQHLEEVEGLLGEYDNNQSVNNELFFSPVETGDSLHSISQAANPSYHHSLMATLGSPFLERSSSRGIVNSTPQKFRTSRISSETLIQNDSPFRSEARPSPERLDAQVRRMAISNDTVMTTLVDQNRQMLESNKSILEAVNKNRLAVEDLQSQLVELKREFAKLKINTTSRSTAEREGDLYNLFPNDEDYAEELDLASSQLSSLQGFPAYQAPYPAYHAPVVPSSQGVTHFASAAAAAAAARSVVPPLLQNPFFPHQTLSIPRNVDPNNLLYQSHLAPYYAQSALGLNYNEGQTLPGTSSVPSVPVPGVTIPGVNIPNPLTPVPPVFPGAAAGLLPSTDIYKSALFSSPLTATSMLSASGSDFTPPSVPQVPKSQALPANVVITSSDVVPTQAPAQQPTLSVTIPSRHIHPQNRIALTSTVASNETPRTTAHNFQISMPPQANIPTTVSLEKSLSPIKPLTNILPDVPKPAFSAVSNVVSPGQGQDEISRVSTGSDNYVEEADYNPCADFKPAISLPDEITVVTGEEDENELFNRRCKLYRFFDGEWRDRGVGQIKILANKATGRPRILMRREQIHKVCANHSITPDMEVSPQLGTDRGFFWVAHDFADQAVQVEKFCAKFKAVEDALLFKSVFDEAREMAKRSLSPAKGAATSSSTTVAVSSSPPTKTAKSGQLELGGFTFTAPPVLKPIETPAKDVTVRDTQKESPQPKLSPFANFVFKQSFPLKPAVLGTPTPSATANVPATSSPATASVPVTSTVVPATSSLSIFGTPTTHPTTGLGKPIVQSTENEPSKTSLFPTIGSKPTFDNTSTLTNALKQSDAPILQGSIDFASLASQNNAFAQKAEFKGFEGAGSKVFGNLTSIKTPQATTPTATSKAQDAANVTGEKESEDTSAGAEEFVPTAEFAPVVALPELVEVKTGEEGCEILFEERAKLLRFDKTTREWKERGVGNMKILKDGATGKLRLLMRREQVLKVCCNHNITTHLKFSPMTASEKAITWSAHDFSEGESQSEVFALRFKTEDLAYKFLELVKDLQQKLSEQTSSPAPPSQVTQATSNKPLSELFKAKEGSWECSSCLVRNDADKTKCLACSTTKPGAVSNEPKQQTDKQPSLAELFKPKAGSWECSGCYSRIEPDKTQCPACQTYKPGHEQQQPKTSTTSTGSKFTFGMPAGTKTEDSKSVSSLLGDPSDVKVTFNFGVPSATATFNFPPAITTTTSTAHWFGSQAKTVSSSTAPISSSTVTSTVPGFKFGSESNALPFAKAAPPFTFGSQSPFSFGSQSAAPSSTLSGPTGFIFGSQPAAGVLSKDSDKFGSPHKFEFQMKKSPVKSPERASGSDESDGEPEERDDLHFQPVIPLPDEVPVHTGEEDETVLFTARAKLFRLADKEWKERGLGDIKILMHNVTKNVRLVMRREKIHKICLNHNVSKELKVQFKDSKTLFWGALDFSESTESPETFTFACRFKTPEIAQEFQTALEASQNDLVPSPVVKSESRSAGSDTSVPGTANDVTPAMKNFSFSLSGQSSSNKSAGVARTLFGESPSSGDEVEIVYEAQVTPEEKAAALKLQLPENFYAYKRAPACTGCAGCEKDSDSDQSESKSIESGTLEPPAVSKPISSAFGGGGSSFFGSNAFSGNLTSVFGGGSTATSANPVFGSFSFAAPVPLVAGKVQEPEKSDNEPVENFLRIDNKVSFANLAAGAATSAAFQTPTGNFSFAGQGSKVFGAKVETPEKKTERKNEDGKEAEEGQEEENEGDDENEGEQNSHDPHFEPIIPLPEIVELSTGEEDEEVCFAQRAVLYRYDLDNKQWKERGRGQMKVLRHPTTQVSRLLLRREQVHKLVLNQLIKSDLKLQVLNSSDRAWCWGSINHAENPAGEGEQLAVRFKTPEQAQLFFHAVEECQSFLAQAQTVSAISERAYAEAKETDDDDYYEDDDDKLADELAKMEYYKDHQGGNDWEHSQEFGEIAFAKLAPTDDDSNFEFYGSESEYGFITITRHNDSAADISFRHPIQSDDIKFKVYILGDSELQKIGKECIWTGIDVISDTEKTFHVTFMEEQYAENFQDLYYQIATECLEDIEDTYFCVEKPED